MIAIANIHVSPIKSLGLINFDEVYVSENGITADRRFFLVDANNQLLTQRQIGKLTQIIADYIPSTGQLTVQFPDGSVITEIPEIGRPIQTNMFGRSVTGKVLIGKFNDAFSTFCGQPIRIVRADNSGTSYDEFPISIISQATIDHLTRMADGLKLFDSRRFRPTFLLSDCQPNQEDNWVNNRIRIGQQLQIKIVSRDPRCAITTLNPITGTRDFDTLRLILKSKPNLRTAYLGVYAIVEEPGTVVVGDEVSVI